MRYAVRVPGTGTVVNSPDLVTAIKVERGKLLVATEFKVYRVQFRPGKPARVRCLGLRK
jgi:hypothetical protein